MRNAAGCQRRKHLLILTPLLPQRLLPVGVGLDAVAVTDMDRRLACANARGSRARQSLRGAFERANAPIGGVPHVDIERGLVELDDVNAVLAQRQRLLVQQFGERHCQTRPVAVVAVGDRVHNGHRPGQRELDLACGVRAQQTGFEGVHATRQADRACDLRHLRVVAVVANAHRDLVLEVDTADLLDKAVDEVLAGLLAVADDVQSGVFLQFDPQQRRIGLGLAQRFALGLPSRPQFFRLGQPVGLWQAAGDRGFEHRISLKLRRIIAGRTPDPPLCTGDNMVMFARPSHFPYPGTE